MCGAFHTLPAEPASACAQSCECGVRVTHESARLYYGIEITTAKDGRLGADLTSSNQLGAAPSGRLLFQRKMIRLMSLVD